MNAELVGQALAVLNSLELLLSSITDFEAAERGYVITGDDSYLEPFRQAASLVMDDIGRLRALTAGNRDRQQLLASAEALVTDRLAMLRTVIGLRKNQGFPAAQAEILKGHGEEFHDRIAT